MKLTKYTECNILLTHYKCEVYKIILVYSKCYDKRGISNLNKIIYNDYQTHEARATLSKLSESVTLIVNSNVIDYLDLIINKPTNVIYQVLSFEVNTQLENI